MAATHQQGGVYLQVLDQQRLVVLVLEISTLLLHHLVVLSTAEDAQAQAEA
jgi:hypothetical protein